MKTDVWIADVSRDYPGATGINDDTQLPIANVWFRIGYGHSWTGAVEVARLQKIYENQGIGFYGVFVPTREGYSQQLQNARASLPYVRGLQFDVEPYSGYLESEGGVQEWVRNVLTPFVAALSPQLAAKEISLCYDPRPQYLDGWDFGGAVSLVDSLAPMVYCVSPETLILTEDLVWRPAEELTVGQPIIAFEEVNAPRHRRRFLRATITANSLRSLPCWDIELENGEVLRASTEHRWLVADASNRFVWKTAAEMLHGQTHVRHGENRLAFPRIFDVHAPERSWDAGFLAGAFDGEGSLSQLGGTGCRLEFVQKPNPMLLEVKKSLLRLDFAFSNHPREDQGTAVVALLGGWRAAARFLTQIRPPRLLDLWLKKVDLHMPVHTLEALAVKRIRPVGNQWVSALSSSSGTYIANGYGAHNTGIYAGQGVWADPIAAINEARKQCPAGKLFRPILQTYHIATTATMASFTRALQLGGIPQLFRRGITPKATWDAIAAIGVVQPPAPPPEEGEEMSSQEFQKAMAEIAELEQKVGQATVAVRTLSGEVTALQQAVAALQRSRPAPAPAPRTKTYVVVPGDSCSAIAERHGITLEQFKKLNARNKPRSGDWAKIYPGERFNVPA